MMLRLTKKHLITVFSLAFCVFSITLSAHAHELWINAFAPEQGLFRAALGYGHNFPALEPIPAERTNIFEPLVLVTPNEKMNMDQKGENYSYQKKIDLKKGTYMVLGFYRPTFWSNGPGGWAQTDRLQRPDANHVEEAIMYAKTIVNVQGATEDSLITQPAGMRLEILPRLNPAKVKVGEKLPIEVFCDGQPAKFVPVEGSFAGFSDNDYKAFSGKTDIRGCIDFIPLKAGYWIIKVRHAFEHPDKERADEIVMLSTLTFNIEN